MPRKQSCKPVPYASERTLQATTLPSLVNCGLESNEPSVDRATAQHSSQVRLDQQPAAQEKPFVFGTARGSGSKESILYSPTAFTRGSQGLKAKSPTLEQELLIHASSAAGKAIADSSLQLRFRDSSNFGIGCFKRWSR